MAYVTLRPNGDDLTTNWNKNSGTYFYENVDEVVSDDDTTYVYSTTNNAEIKFTLPDVPITHPIRSVSLFWRSKWIARVSTLTPKLYVGSDSLTGSVKSSNNYTEFSDSFKTNPLGNPWTSADIQNLKIGFRKQDNSEEVRITQCYILIEIVERGEHWPLSSNIVALYHLEDMTDSSGNGHDLDLAEGAPEYRSGGKFGKYIYIPGAAYVKCADYIINPNNAFSISCWFYVTALPTGLSSYEFWRARYNGSPHDAVARLQYSLGDTPRLWLSSSGVGLYYPIDLELNRWYKVDVVSKGNSQTDGLKLYLNGSLVAKIDTDTPGDYASSHLFTVGNNAINKNSGIDEVVVFNYERSANEIARRYAWESRGYCARVLNH